MLFIASAMMASAQTIHECYEIGTSECGSELIVQDLLVKSSLSAYSSFSNLLILVINDFTTSDDSEIILGDILDPYVSISSSGVLIPGLDGNTNFEMGDLTMNLLRSENSKVAFFAKTVVSGSFTGWGNTYLSKVMLLNNVGGIISSDADWSSNSDLNAIDSIIASGAYFYDEVSISGDLDSEDFIMEGDVEAQNVIASNLVGPLNLKRACDQQSAIFRVDNGFEFNFVEDVACNSGDFCEEDSDCASGTCLEGGVCA